MTEATPAAPESAPTLDLGRRVFARQARAESRLSPWTRRDLAGKTIVRELRFAQRIARRVYGRGAAGVTFEGPLSPNAPRGVARFSEKVAERNTLADVARKYGPAEDAGAADAAPKTAAGAPMPLAGGGEGGGPRNAGPAISAAEALQRLAVTRPDLDPDASPFAKLFKTAMSSAQPSESTLQRGLDSGRRVVETFQRGGPRPKANAAPPAPVQPRTDRPPAPIQRRADPSAPAAPLPAAVTPPPERPPAAPTSKAIRRFAKVEEVVPANFTPPSDDFGDDLPEPGGPVIQRALPPVPGEALPLARRPETSPPPAQAPASVVQPRRPAMSAPAPKRQAAPAPARLQRRTAAPAARPAPQVDLRGEAPSQLRVPPSASPQRLAADAGGELAERPIEAASEGQAARQPIAIQRKPDSAQAMPPAAEDRPVPPPSLAPMAPRPPAQAGQAGETSDPGPLVRADAQRTAPIQREPLDAPGGDLPLARPARPETPSDATPRASSAERAAEQTASSEVTAPVLVASPARDGAAANRPPAPIQRATSEEAAKELPLARPAEPPPIPPAAPIQRAPDDDAAKEPPLVRPSEPALIPPAAPPPAAVIQRAASEEAAKELLLVRASELAPTPPAAPLPAAPLPAAPIQRAASDQAAKELPLVQPAELSPTPPAAPLPAAPIQRAPIDDAAKELPLVRPSELAPTPPPAAPPPVNVQRATNEGAAKERPLVRPPDPAAPPPAAILRQPIEDVATEMPLARPVEPTPAPPVFPVQRQPFVDAANEQPPARPSEAPAPIQAKTREGSAENLPLARPQEPIAAPPAPIQRQPDARQPVELPLPRTAVPEMPPAGEPSSRAQSPVPASDETPASLPIRPRPSALNLAHRAVQRMMGEGPLPLSPTPASQSAPGQTPPPASADDAPAPRPIVDLTQRRVASVPIRPDAQPSPTTWTDTERRPTAPMPARIQRASAAMPAVARAVRGGEAMQPGADASEMRRSADRGDQLPLVVPLLAAQSQSASRHIQRDVALEPGGTRTGTATTPAPSRASASRPAGYSSELAPKVGLKAPTPEQPAPAKGNEPDLNYDLLAQRVYPFIRRLLAFERERERGS